MRVQQQKTIILDEFNEIELYFKGNVRIKQGGKYTITFIGQPKPAKLLHHSETQRNNYFSLL